MKRLALTAVLLAGTALATNASAATFTSDHCGGGGCGPQPNGFATITGTQLGTDLVGITITPLNGNGLVNGGQTTFTFNLIGNPTITYVGLPSTFDVVNSTTNTQTAGSIHQAACIQSGPTWRPRRGSSCAGRWPASSCVPQALLGVGNPLLSKARGRRLLTLTGFAEAI